MKIFVSTASVGDVQWATDSGLAEGVITSPGALRDVAGDGEERGLLADICRATTGPVCATVGAVTAADIYRDARELARISDQILVQIPLLEEAVGAMRRPPADDAWHATCSRRCRSTRCSSRGARKQAPM